MIEAAKYIADQLLSPPAAGRLLDDAEAAINSLSEMPHRHGLVGDEVLSRQGLRFIPIKKYLAFYTVREESKSVVIQRFLYGRRDWLTILKGENN